MDSLVCFGVWLYQNDRRSSVGPQFTRRLVHELAAYMGSILLCDDAWPRLQACEVLLTDVVRYIAQDSPRVNLVDPLEDPEHLAEDESMEE